MNYMVVAIIDDIDDCPAILDAWEAAGVSGVTILPSTGLGRIRRAGLRDDIPLMPSLHNLLEGNEEHHRTLLSVVDSQELVNTMIAGAQKVISDFKKPHTGFLFVVPVIQMIGLGKKNTDQQDDV